MSRKTQISKDVILEAAFRMLLRDGYAAINITSLAKEIGCSTQPIAWHFGNMEGLRTELLEYCLVFLKDRFTVQGEGVAGILEGIAFRYVELAFDYPNLYKYLYMSEQDGQKMAAIAQSLRAENHDKVILMLEKEHGISADIAEKYLLNVQLYVHGIASFAVSKISFPSKEVVMQMIHDASEAFLIHGKSL
ncbi:MAG: TetR/AcrR family transcriptional regulator [Roseburia sp.]|nr:TetR/AcrR family transcriptional regulator [Roseburia sp.]